MAVSLPIILKMFGKLFWVPIGICSYSFCSALDGTSFYKKSLIFYHFLKSRYMPNSGVARIFWVVGNFPAELFWGVGSYGQLIIDWAIGLQFCRTCCLIHCYSRILVKRISVLSTQRRSHSLSFLCSAKHWILVVGRVFFFLDTKCVTRWSRELHIVRGLKRQSE
jgi:hypothetical protein